MLTRRTFINTTIGITIGAIASTTYAADSGHSFHHSRELELQRIAIQRQATLALMAGTISNKLQQVEFDTLIRELDAILVYVAISWIQNNISNDQTIPLIEQSTLFVSRTTAVLAIVQKNKLLLVQLQKAITAISDPHRLVDATLDLMNSQLI